MLWSGAVCFANPPRAPAAAIISEDASLVAAEIQGRVTVWQRSSGKQLASFTAHQFFRGAVTRGALVLIGEDSVKLRRGPRFARTVLLETPKTLSMGRTSIAANGRVAAAFYPKDGGVGDPDTAVVWDTLSGAVVARLPLASGRLQGTTLSGDGRLLALFGDVPGKRALLRVYRAGRKGYKLWLRWDGPGDRTTYGAVFSRDGRRLVLAAGTRLLLWDLDKKRILRSADTSAIKALFPAALRGPRVRMPGAHLLAISADGKQLATLHGFQVVGVARWSLPRLKPLAWIKRPRGAGSMRGLAWDASGKLHLVSATYSTNIWLHAPRGDRFVTVRTLSSTQKR